jgi:hypothetical protein
MNRQNFFLTMTKINIASFFLIGLQHLCQTYGKNINQTEEIKGE